MNDIIYDIPQGPRKYVCSDLDRSSLNLMAVDRRDHHVGAAYVRIVCGKIKMVSRVRRARGSLLKSMVKSF